MSAYGDYLPTFPSLAEPVTEERLERLVEGLMNRADNTLVVTRNCTQEQYDLWSKALDRWAEKVAIRKD